MSVLAALLEPSLPTSPMHLQVADPVCGLPKPPSFSSSAPCIRGGHLEVLVSMLGWQCLDILLYI